MSLNAVEKETKMQNEDPEFVEKCKLDEWKEDKNNSKKQFEISSNEPEDVERRQQFAKKIVPLVVVIFICIATSVVWMVGPLVAFNRRHGQTQVNCRPQPYKGKVCRDVLENKTFYFGEADMHTFGSQSSMQYMMEVAAAVTLRSALCNSTQCELSVEQCVCFSAFGMTTLASGDSSGPINSIKLCLNETATAPPVVDYQSNGGLANNACSQLFYYDTASGFCRPTCAVFIGGNEFVMTAFNILGIIGCIVAFAVSISNYKIMCRFPSILLIYWLVSALVYYVVLTVKCCSGSDYFDDYNNPGFGCQLKAFLSMFLAYLIALFPVEHTIILFVGVWFPYFSRNTFNNARKRLYVHAFILTVAFIVPVLVCSGLIAVYATGNISDGIEYYYSFVPFYGMCGLIAALVGLSIWKLMKMDVQPPEERHRYLKCCTPEFKLAAVFTYASILFGTTVVRHVLETYRTYGYVDDYFLCESSGAKVCALQPDDFNRAINGFSTLHVLVFALSPYASLIYIMPVHLMKQKMTRWRSKPTSVTSS